VQQRGKRIGEDSAFGFIPGCEILFWGTCLNARDMPSVALVDWAGLYTYSRASGELFAQAQQSTTAS